MNITREPRNGRNFEYQGEDPILAGKMAAQLIKGVQDQKIISDVKHYAFNDQETGRNIGNVIVSPNAWAARPTCWPLRSPSSKPKPGMVMCSYNKLNGDWACENSYLLNDLLKKTWGFQGFVMSDWGGTHSTIKAVLAGLDNEQPESRFLGEALKKAVDKGDVPMSRVDDMVHRIVRTEFASGVFDDPPKGRVVDPFRGADTAQAISEQGSVLLKNAGNQLPLNAATYQIDRHHRRPCRHRRFVRWWLSASGSSRGRSQFAFSGPPVWIPSSPLKAIRAKAPKAKVEFNDGSDPAAAAALAKSAQVAIVFVNQPTSEGQRSPYAHPARQSGRARQCRRRCESAYHRCARNGWTCRHALDR